MTEKSIINKELERGDIAILYSWEELQKIFENETSEDECNLVAPNGHRSFYKEKELYGKSYIVKSSNTSLFWGTTIHCFGKSELCPQEIKKIVKKKDKDYNRLLNKIKS